MQFDGASVYTLALLVSDYFINRKSYEIKIWISLFRGLIEHTLILIPNNMYIDAFVMHIM